MATGPSRLRSSLDPPMTTREVPPGTVMTRKTRAGIPRRWVVGPDGSLLLVDGQSVEQVYSDAEDKISRQVKSAPSSVQPIGTPQNLFVGDSSNWDRHVWSNSYQASPYAQRTIGSAVALQTRRDLQIANDLMEQARGRSDAMVDLQAQAYAADQARGGDGAPMGGPEMVGPQRFDGDSIAWKAFLNQMALATGGKRNPYQNRSTRQMQANAARIDTARRSDYLRYIEAGGTSGYNDWLIENGLHARQGGW